MRRILFLPGAGGSPTFWQPVATRLPADWTKVHFGWPGLGNEPHDPAISSMDDLVSLVTDRLDEPSDLVAQSMGGVIAVRAALERPEMVRRLVLCVTSGGVDMSAFGASDWRLDYRRSFPNAVPWITNGRASQVLPVERIVAPALLIWGDADEISPVAVGRHLLERLPNARLEIVAGGGHDVAVERPEIVAGLIERSLRNPAP